MVCKVLKTSRAFCRGKVASKDIGILHTMCNLRPGFNSIFACECAELIMSCHKNIVIDLTHSCCLTTETIKIIRDSAERCGRLGKSITLLVNENQEKVFSRALPEGKVKVHVKRGI